MKKVDFHQTHTITDKVGVCIRTNFCFWNADFIKDDSDLKYMANLCQESSLFRNHVQHNSKSII